MRIGCGHDSIPDKMIPSAWIERRIQGISLIARASGEAGELNTLNTIILVSAEFGLIFGYVPNRNISNVSGSCLSAMNFAKK